MIKCKGCGVALQYDNKDEIGYSPKKEAEYCQRCFRLMHYDDLQISMKQGIDPDLVLAQVNKIDGLILWVVDLFDFEGSIIEGINRHLAQKDIVMIATKRDILPESLGMEKIARFVFSRLKESGITIKGLIVTGKNIDNSKAEVMNAVELLANHRPVIVMGKANAGKSTLLNQLLGKNQLTSSRYPGTTLDFNELEIDGYTFIDTPGIEGKKTMLMAVEEKDLQNILPYKKMKPKVYQCQGSQSFTIGGLARVEFANCDHATAVFYLANGLQIHRSKISNADALWEKHYGELYKPIPQVNEFTTVVTNKKLDKMDIVIDGLGWVTISGQVSEIKVKYPKAVNVTFRKAML